MIRKNLLYLATALVLTATASFGCRGSSGRLASRSGSTSAIARNTLNEAPAAAAANKLQRTCPVTGEELGSMGEPIPVNVKGETIFVCCQGCVKKVQQNPDKYLAKAHAETRI